MIKSICKRKTAKICMIILKKSNRQEAWSWCVKNIHHTINKSSLKRIDGDYVVKVNSRGKFGRVWMVKRPGVKILVGYLK